MKWEGVWRVLRGLGWACTTVLFGYEAVRGLVLGLSWIPVKGFGDQDVTGVAARVFGIVTLAMACFLFRQCVMVFRGREDD